MLEEYTFTPKDSKDGHKCHFAICDDTSDFIEDTAESFWRKYGFENCKDWGAFIFKRAKNGDSVCFIAVALMKIYALEYALNSIEIIGDICPIHELIEIIRDFDKKYGIK